MHDMQDILSGQCKWAVAQADRLEFLRRLPESSVDLIFGSPPY
jgi:hypothetical protein